MLERSSGILLPVFSLYSDYGTGTLGKAAFDFVDFLTAAGQTYWQILPINPIGYGGSPYQCTSSFAGNPYFIDLKLLFEEGLISKSDLENARQEGGYIDYENLEKSRMPLLKKAARNGLSAAGEAAGGTASCPWGCRNGGAVRPVGK